MKRIDFWRWKTDYKLMGMLVNRNFYFQKSNHLAQIKTDCVVLFSFYYSADLQAINSIYK